MVSFALQENFGFSMLEAKYLGCKVVVPNRLVYPEFYGKTHLFDTFDESVQMVEDVLDNYNTNSIEAYRYDNKEIMEMWFNE